MSEENKKTHEVTTPNKRPPTDIEVLRGNLEGEFKTTVANYFSGNEQETIRFKTAVVDYVRKVPKLLECDRISLLSAFVQLAQFRFMPSGVMGEAYVIPYGKEAKFQIGYQGLVTLLYRTSQVKAISANIIYENDDFDYEEGINPKLYHKPAPFGKDKGKEVGVYTVVQLEGGARTFKVMSEADVMQIKALSKAKGTADSPWNSDKDPFKGMWKKTCLIQHSKFLPKTADFQLALEKDMEGEGYDRSGLDSGGIAVGKSFHSPKKENEQV
jgi:recombination protein RecT